MAGSSIGQIGLDLVVNKNEFDRQMGGIQKLAAKAGKVLASAFAAKKLFDFGAACVELGSDLAEVQNVVDVTFPAMSKQVDAFAQSAAASFGLSETMAKQFAGTFGSMAKAFGFSEKQAYEMGTALTGLAGDVASFYNITQDEAYTKLKSVFTGETESLKDLGIVMTQTALDSYALANGFGKTTAKMTEAEKVALRYQFVQEQLTGAAGDFARTSDGWANQVRVLKLQFDSLKATIGQGLINVLTPVIKLINMLVGKLFTLANAFKAFTEMFSGKKGADDAAGLQSVAAAADGAAASTQAIGDAAAASAKKMKGLFAFDDMNVVNSSDDSSGDTSGYGAESFDMGTLDTSGIEEAGAKYQTLIDKAKELAGIFRQGFEIGFGDGEEKIGSVLQHIQGIGKSLKDLLKDDSVKAAAEGMAGAFVENLGEIAGSFSRIGLTAADTLLNGYDAYLQNNKGYIKERLVSIFDISGEIADTAGDLSTAFADIFEAFGSDSAKGCAEDLIGTFADSFLSIREMSLRLGSDIMECIAGPIIENKDAVRGAIEDTLTPLDSVLGSFHELVQNTFQKVFQAYEEYVEPAFERISGGLSTVFSGALEAYESYLLPVVEWISERFSLLVSDYIHPLTESFVEFAGKAVEALSMLWEFMAPFVTWFAEKLVVQITSGLQWMWVKVEYMVSVISVAVKGIMDICSGLIDFIVGIFTGDFEKALGGIREICDAVGTSIKGIFQAVGNLVSNVFTAITNTADNALSLLRSLVDKALNAVMSVFANIFSCIKNTVSVAFTAVAGTVEKTLSRLKEVVTRSLNAIAAVFKNIFNGIWSMVKNVINSILGGVEVMTNGLIRGINGMVSALNRIHFDIPDWVPGLGGKSFGISLPTLAEVSIPRLAQGGYVKPNTPQLAMIGDNRHQGEIVAPEDKIYQISAQAMKDVMQQFMAVMTSLMNNGMLGKDVTVVVKVTGEMAPFVRMLKAELDKEDSRMGVDFKVVYE